MRKGRLIAGICAMAMGLVLVIMGAYLLPPVAQPPVITSATSASGTVGTAFSYQITAANSPTSYGVTGLPAGLAVNTGTRLISGTPTTAGTYTVTLSATNSGGTGTAILTLPIKYPAPPPPPLPPPSPECDRSFVKYVTEKFDPKYFTLTSATNNAELQVEYNSWHIHRSFEIACLFRTRAEAKGIEWASASRFGHSQEIVRQKSIPVFVIVGEGGEPSAPAELFIIPLDEIKGLILSRSLLNEHRRPTKRGRFYLDTKTMQLQ